MRATLRNVNEQVECRNRLPALMVRRIELLVGGDPKVFTYSQPVRVPGAWREGRLQRVIWLRE